MEDMLNVSNTPNSELEDMLNVSNALNSELEENISFLEENISELKEKISKLAKKYNTLQSAHDLLKTEHMSLNKQIQLNEKENREHSEKMNNCEVHKKKLETDVSAYNDKNRSCEDDYNLCQHDIEKYITEREEYKNKWLQYLKGLPDIRTCILTNGDNEPNCTRLEYGWKNELIPNF
jgi:chromosome segregation ATPase